MSSAHTEECARTGPRHSLSLKATPCAWMVRRPDALRAMVERGLSVMGRPGSCCASASRSCAGGEATPCARLVRRPAALRAMVANRPSVRSRLHSESAASTRRRVVRAPRRGRFIRGSAASSRLPQALPKSEPKREFRLSESVASRTAHARVEHHDAARWANPGRAGQGLCEVEEPEIHGGEAKPSRTGEVPSSRRSLSATFGFRSP